MSDSVFTKIENSFKKAMRGEELINILIYYWGIIGYVTAYLVDKIIGIINMPFISALVSIMAIIYFIWHIYVLKKCSPKKPKLTKEEKQKISAEKRRDFVKSCVRKMLLQEPITRFSPAFTVSMIDIFSIANFLMYLI